MNIGEKIKDYRKEAGLTQKQLAEKINRKEITIRKYESGEREPRISVLEEICDALDIPIDVFGEELFQIKNIKGSKNLRDSLELYKKYQSDPTYKYGAQFNLVEQLMLLYGYKYEHYFRSGRTEEDNYKINDEIQNNTISIGKITNLNTSEEFEILQSDLDEIFSNCKRFFDFEIFKLKNKSDKKNDN
ncbi:MAG: helix-turn-helix transcriptional regulator [Clostridium sp.]|uniref:helix-turn-helix domain-containing protein n=1 Tax=Clostridium sp. TaxID=1506 RepID=UPI0028FFC795|nr:helix-turn-helix transcriptional regulator [Clostridium sp.]MDU2895692.1 helix-turn-helix transcriptional regulator [Clostridium sp.]MDU3008084.1 helix-turn-helix transcriptional regulator [Clostridium sp.]MDU3037967.1 helix-turn-helix transcriptional regulator [Clostridium sp.]MDU3052917.1 helix-turn-helix transcriptional regulator [Clostridium sp.]